ncbi:MAG TPA: hypothetical protein VFQ61_18505 [Polyangiaceae bacterium]|nr:hypothetical protein [Polyangiaceae bacterium]
MTKLAPSISALLLSLPLVACDFGSSTDTQGSAGSPPVQAGGTPSSSGGATGAGGTTAAKGGATSTSTNATGGSTSTGPSGFGTPMQQGLGSTPERYAKADVIRNGVNYRFMANGWGPGFQSQSVSWSGTSFTVVSMEGKQGGNWEPASYPTTFCGVYSDDQSQSCGLPKAIADIKSLRTGWRWSANGNTNQYNAAYDIWLGDGNTVSTHRSFLMVWLRDPQGQQPAGSKKLNTVQVANVQGTWDVWVGVVGGKPCISYARPEGQDLPELEFDVMDFIRDVKTRSIDAPGSTVLSVAVGFEIWNGPITNLKSEDFYVDVK